MELETNPDFSKKTAVRHRFDLHPDPTYSIADIFEEPSSSIGRYFNSSLKLYMQEMGFYPTLASGKLIELSRKVAEGIKAREKISTGQYQNSEEKEGLLEIALEGKNAQNQIIEGNVRLVIRIAKKFDHYNIPGFNILDFIQEGNIGLINASLKFDPERNIRFSTYAAYWIRAYVLRAIHNKSRMIRLPVGIEQDIHKLLRFSERFTNTNGHYPTKEDIAHGLQKSKEYVERVIQANALNLPSTPLNEYTEDEAGATEYWDIIEDRNTHDPLEEVITQDTRLRILEAIENLVIYKKKGGRPIEANLQAEAKSILRSILSEDDPAKQPREGSVGIASLTPRRYYELKNAALKQMRISNPELLTLLDGHELTEIRKIQGNAGQKSAPLNEQDRTKKGPNSSKDSIKIISRQFDRFKEAYQLTRCDLKPYQQKIFDILVSLPNPPSSYEEVYKLFPHLRDTTIKQYIDQSVSVITNLY